ncbi:MAG TPA: hypothetical protein ENK04_06915 [Gammaproteobacteria bacterium]|nr:hypothetical protein [Gammaproteobacteria bacterium]
MKLLTLIITSIIISACGNSGDTTSSTIGTSPITGVWFTQSCIQAADSSGALIPLWVIGKYEFTTDGFIQFSPVNYDDSQCLTKSQPPTTNTLTPPTYIDKGETTLQEGIKGYAITIIFKVPNDVFTVDTFYTINNDTLCFSNTLTVEPLKFGFSQTGGDAINFNDCLIK